MKVHRGDNNRINGISPHSTSQTRPLLYRVSVAMEQLSVSRATIYRMVARGELELVKIGARSSRITSASVARIAQQSKEVE